ncbi:hypothetical protein CBR_g46815 [Chara braunii]|uniref:histidine kinase n=1 Tax=Chara braunii TaxID=69332 RepID=A0A388M100_CHABU|nr:hypothetical protein CBR_g46815 [Chara braunii]|eukprot:GBG88248.1 hypothetical protein CBR_g46815 [Chara braunii]
MDPNIRAYILHRPSHFRAVTFADNSWTLWDNGIRVHTLGNINTFYHQAVEHHLVWLAHQEHYVDVYPQVLQLLESNPAEPPRSLVHGQAESLPCVDRTDSATDGEGASSQDDDCAIPFYLVRWIEEEHRAICPKDNSTAPGVNMEFLSMAFMGSFSRSAVNQTAGAKTTVSNIVMATVILFTLSFITPLFVNIPQCVLSAIIIQAVLSLALEHWKQYMLGRHFKVYSGHETLRWLKTQAKMTPKLTRWAAEIDQYDFELKPVKGKYNVVADALSRRSDYFGAIVHYLDIGKDLQEKVRQAYAQDPIYSDLLKRVKEAPETEPDYRTTEGPLFEKTNVVDRLCIPNSEEIRSLILGECRDTEGHFGWQETLANLMRVYTWHGMKADCIEYVRGCKVCQRNKTTTRAPLGLLRPLPIPYQPGDSVSIDFMDAGVKSGHGQSQVMVIVDRFSKPSLMKRFVDREVRESESFSSGTTIPLAAWSTGQRCLDSTMACVDRRSNSSLPAERDVCKQIDTVIAQSKVPGNRPILRNLVIGYFACLLLVIGLCLVSPSVLHTGIRQTKTSDHVIRMAWGQLVLSQSVCRSANTILMDCVKQKPYADDMIKLSTRYSEWKIGHDGLANGNSSLGLPAPTSNAIRSLYNDMRPSFHEIDESVNAILAYQAANVSNLTDRCDATFETQTASISSNLSNYTQKMNQVLAEYEVDRQRCIDSLMVVMWVLHAVAILILLVQGAFVIRPLHGRLLLLISERYELLRRSFEAEAESRGVSLLMVSYVSHELREPLDSAIAYIRDAAHHLLDYMRELPSREIDAAMLQADCMAAQDKLNQAMQNCQLMNTVISDVADMRRLELGRMTLAVDYISVADAVRQVVRTLEPKLNGNKSVRLTTDLDSAVLWRKYLCDQHRLEQVLLNLTSNAIKFCDEGVVTVHARPTDDGLRFEVSDTGSGLPEEAIQKLFDPFMETPYDKNANKSGGTGLGLYIVKLLIDLQGGSYGVYSEPSIGTTFWFELPAQNLESRVSMERKSMTLEKRSNDSAIHFKIAGPPPLEAEEHAVDVGGALSSASVHTPSLVTVEVVSTRTSPLLAAGGKGGAGPPGRDPWEAASRSD